MLVTTRKEKDCVVPALIYPTRARHRAERPEPESNLGKYRTEPKIPHVKLCGVNRNVRYFQGTCGVVWYKMMVAARPCGIPQNRAVYLRNVRYTANP